MDTNERKKMNTYVAWIENIKAFFTKLTQEAVGLITKNSYKVTVENPTTEVSVNNFFELYRAIEELKDLIAEKPDFEQVDITPIVEAVKAIPEPKEISLPEPLKQISIEEGKEILKALKSVADATTEVREAIKAIEPVKMPEQKMANLKNIEKALSEIYELAKDKNVTVSNFPIEEEKEEPTIVYEELIRNINGKIIGSRTTYSDGVVLTEEMVFNRDKELVGVSHAEEIVNN